jgi:hypothetical protein
MQREGSWVNAVADATKFQKKAASAFSKVEREAMQRAAKRDKKLAEITGKIDEAQEQSAAAAKALDEGNLEDFPGIPKKLLSKLEKARAGVAKVEEGVQESLTYLAKKEANTDALVRALRRTGDELAKYAKALDSAAPDAMDGDRALKALDAIYTTSGSALRGLSPANPLTWALTAQVATRRLINVFDPIKTRVKEFAKPIRDAQVVAERHGNQLQDELRGLSTLKGAPGLIFEWLTSSRAITIGGVRTTAENRLSENTLWDDAVSHMIEEVIDVETGLAIPQVKSGGKRALQALSRVWLPPGHTATKDALDTLERHTAAWLKEGVSLEDLIHGRDHLRSLSNDIVQTTLSDMASTEEAVMGAAAAVLAGANTERMMERIARIVGPPVDSDTAWSITRILSGFGAEDYEKTKALAFKADEALDVMAEWGISLLPTKDRSVFQRLFNLQPKVSRMVAYGQLASLQGRPMYVPDAFLKNIDEYNKTFFKLVEDSSDVGLTQKAFRPYKTFMSTWQRAAVQGVVLPNAGRPALTIFTDAFSLLQEEGLHKAPQIAALMSETALGYIPYVGAKMQSALAQMAAKADGKTVLGSLLNAVFDPVVDMLMRGKRSTATLKTGSGTLSLDAVMKGAIERGVMSKQFAGVPEEYFQRTALQGGMWKKMRETGTKLNSLVRETTSAFEEAQIRQRLSLYVKKLKEGATEDEAAQAVLNSFYDWDHGVAKWEMQALANIFVFPTMWRLIFNQQFRAMSEALSVPKSMGKAGKLQQLTDAAVHLSNSRLARARKLITLQQGIPETLAEHPSDTDMLDDLEATQAYYQAARPWYHDAQTALTNSQIAPERSKWWKETTGKTVTYEAWTMPETTQSETWQSIGTVMALASGASFFADEGTEFSQDAFDSFLEDVLMDRMTPAVKEFSSGAAEKLGYEARPESKRLRAAERVMLRPLDNSMKEMGMNFLNSDQTALMSEAGPAMLSGLRMIPGASTGTTWVNAVKANNPNFDLGEYQAGIAHMLAHLAGRVRVTGFDPVSDDVYATKKAKGQLSRLRNAVDKEAKQTPLRERDPGESER